MSRGQEAGAAPETAERSMGARPEPGARAAAAWSDELFDYATLTPERVTAIAEAAIAAAERLLGEATAAATSSGARFEDVIGRIDRAEGEVWDAHGCSAFTVNVHPDAAVRDAAQRAGEQITAWQGDLPLRDEVNAAISAWAAGPEAAGLVGERRRLLDQWLRELRRAGHHLPPETRREVRELTARIVGIERAFERNVAEWSDGVDVAETDLEGLASSYVARLRPGQQPGSRRVTLDYPDYFPFMESSPRRAIREVLARKMASRAVAANRPLLEEVIELRRRKAALLGYPSWGHFRIEPKMAANPERVDELHAGILEPLGQLAEIEHESMRDLLEARSGTRDLQQWDVRYLHQQILATEHGIDAEAISEHLPLERVFAGLLELVEEVFGLRISEFGEPHAWHPDVRLFDVRDAASGERLGWFYADLYPRDGKFGHAMAWPVRLARGEADGRRRGGVSAIVMNVPRPGPDAPALLRHDDMVTLFHEFGHVLHEVLGRNESHRLSMFGMEDDFPEAISQIMEHWAWHPEILVRIGRHHATGAPMPAALAEGLAATRNVDMGDDYLRGFGAYGVFDMSVHRADPIDLDEAMRAADAVRRLPSMPDTFWPASFMHIVAGYDAGYYGYLWSKVYGDDLWSRFESEGILNPETGAAYRRDLLEPGATADAEVLVERFLGRPASNATFLRLSGLDVAEESRPSEGSEAVRAPANPPRA